MTLRLAELAHEIPTLRQNLYRLMSNDHRCDQEMMLLLGSRSADAWLDPGRRPTFHTRFPLICVKGAIGTPPYRGASACAAAACRAGDAQT